MLSTEDLRALKERVREHGRYRELAEEIGVSESFLAKFATQPGDGYTLKTIRLVAEHFAKQDDQERNAA